MAKPPSPPISPLRKLQKASLGVVERSYAATGDKVKAGATSVTQALRTLDKSVGITKRLARAGVLLRQMGTELDSRFDVTAKASGVAAEVTSAATRGADAVMSAAEDAGITDTVRSNLVEPAKKAFNAVREHETTIAALDNAERGYGAARSIVKETFAPKLLTYDSHELLLQTRRELEYVAACIMQINEADSAALASQFGRALASKIAGTATAGGIVAVAASLGTAGTGTPIAMLTGAAATKASLAWIGGLVGGGVATGTALTGGVAFVVGLTAYRALRSERRDFVQMTPQEQRLVQACWLLASICDELSTQPVPSRETINELFRDGLLPLYKELRDNTASLTANLDAKHRVAFRQHMLHDYEDGVVRRFSAYLSWRHSAQGEAWTAQAHVELRESAQARSAAALENAAGNDATYRWPRGINEGNFACAVGGAFAALLTRHALDGSPESRVFLEAVGRANPALAGAPQEEIVGHIRGLAARSDESLRAFANNVKGIFHEELFAEHVNEQHGPGSARLYDSSTHPASDIELKLPGEPLTHPLQLKAVSTAAPVYHHLDLHPDVPVAVTHEMASRIHDPRVTDSGFCNDDLTAKTDANLHALETHTIVHRVGSTAELAAAVTSAAEVMQMLRGEREFPEAILNVVAKTGVSAGAMAVTALLFG